MTGPGKDPSTEIEFKLILDAAAEERVRRALREAPGREGGLRTRSLVSVYCDTPEARLAEGGIALRIRRDGRRWLQTAKKREQDGSPGYFAVTEVERPAPGGRLLLGFDEPTGLIREIGERINGAEVGPVFETRVKRTSARLRLPRGVVEVAIDRGEVIAGALSAPIRELEIELLEGEIGAVFEAARILLPEGPLALAHRAKSERGWQLARTGQADPPVAPRRAGIIAFPRDATVEQAAREIFRDCFRQITDNLLVVCASEDPEGPHQLRVGLRRLRTAFSLFRPALGAEVLTPLGDEARRIGRVVGELRDLDVLIGEIIAEAGEHGLDPGPAAALAQALEAGRGQVREAVRRDLAGAATTRFLIDLAEMIEGRGWISPTDYSQSERLARPFADFAPARLDSRYRKVIRRGRRLDELDSEGLHELRKEMKKLRYTIELCAPLFGDGAEAKMLKAARKLQDCFGAINDAAMAGELLQSARLGDAAGDEARWAAGWIVGRLAAEAEHARADLARRWQDFERRSPFWH
jgi:triphosphatase